MASDPPLVARQASSSHSRFCKDTLLPQLPPLLLLTCPTNRASAIIWVTFDISSQQPCAIAKLYGKSLENLVASYEKLECSGSKQMYVQLEAYSLYHPSAESHCPPSAKVPTSHRWLPVAHFPWGAKRPKVNDILTSGFLA